MNWINNQFDIGGDDNLPHQIPHKRARRQPVRRGVATGNSFSSPIRSKTGKANHARSTIPVASCVEFGVTKEMLKNLEEIDFDMTSIIEEEDDDDNDPRKICSWPSAGKSNANKCRSNHIEPPTSSAPQLRLVASTTKSVRDELMPWTEKYRPTSLDQLFSIHPTKLSELQQWFDALYPDGDHDVHNRSSAGNSTARMLVISGPSGCGKTVAVQLVARDRSVQVHEHTVASVSTVAEDLGEVNFTSQFQRFRQFMLGTNNSLDGRRSSKLILIKDLPHSASTHTWMYQEFLDNYIRCIPNAVPVVFIFTLELGSNKMRDRLFPKQSVCERNRHSIEFNGVGKRAMAKVLNSIVSSQIAKSKIDSLIESCDGDLRNAINVLEFAVGSELRTTMSSDRPVKSTSRNRRANSTSTKDFAFCLGGKDTAPMFFHFLGKILYCKRNPLTSFVGSIEQLPDHLSSLQRYPLKENPDRLLEQLYDVSDNLLLFLQQNYTHFMSDDIHSAARCVGWLSAADESFSSRHSWNAPLLSDYGHSICLRGVMFNVPSHSATSKRSYYTFEKPRYFEQTRRIQEMERLSTVWRSKHQPTSRAPYRLLIDDLPFFVRLNRNVAHTQSFTSQLSSIYGRTTSAPLSAGHLTFGQSNFETENQITPDLYESHPIIDED
jgi:hypothetical protein